MYLHVYLHLYLYLYLHPCYLKGWVRSGVGLFGGQELPDFPRPGPGRRAPGRAGAAAQGRSRGLRGAATVTKEYERLSKFDPFLGYSI